MKQAAAAAGGAGRRWFTAVQARRYSTTPSPPSPPPKRPSNRLLPLTAGIVLLAGGAYLYLSREEPSLLGYDRWTPVKIKSVTPLTPETSLFRLEVPKSLLPPGLDSDPSARPILSLFVKEPNLQIQRAYTVRRGPSTRIAQDLANYPFASTAPHILLLQPFRSRRA